MVAQNYVLRSVYLDPEFDNFLREQAFRLNISKNDLIRDYLERGAKEQLGEAIKADSPGSSRAFTSGVIRAAVGANLLLQVNSKSANKASFELSPTNSSLRRVGVAPLSGASGSDAGSSSVARGAPAKVAAKTGGLGRTRAASKKAAKKTVKKVAKKAAKK